MDSNRIKVKNGNFKVIFEDGFSSDINWLDNEVSRYLQNCYKHLKHVPLDFKQWDNFLYTSKLSKEKVLENFISYATAVNVNIDKTQIFNQNYLNYLHEIYEKRYDGTNKWLNFHEHIHLIESLDEVPYKQVKIDFREQAGLLECDFKKSWTNLLSTKFKKGDVLLLWAELGKTPYDYWKTGEPNNITRLTELCKPFVKLKPITTVLLEDHTFIPNESLEEFYIWWHQFHSQWCSYWNIKEWGQNEIFGAIQVGTITNSDQLLHRINNFISPKGIE